MFEIPESKAAAPEGRFQFKLNGQERSAPLITLVDSDVAEAFNAAITEVDQRMAYIKALADHDDEVESLLRRLNKDQLEALVAAYDTASGITAGESGASTDS